MGPMLVAEGVSSITGLVDVINDLITVAGTVIQFGLTTFPINVGVAVGLVGCVAAFIRKVKPSAKA